MTNSKLKGGPTPRTLFWGGVVAALGIFMVWAFWPAPRAVDVETVTRGALSVYVRAEGRTRVSEIYSISAPVMGRVLRISAKAGDSVEAGKTVLAVIEPADHWLRVAGLRHSRRRRRHGRHRRRGRHPGGGYPGRQPAAIHLWRSC